MIRLSVITICFNSADTIEATIKSIVGQKTDEVEYLIIDGGSQDGTMNIVDKYRDRIDYVVSESDKGISDAFNKGIRAAKGEWISIINSDDMFLPGAIGKLLEELDDKYDVYIGNGVRCFDDGTCKPFYSLHKPSLLKYDMPFCHPATFVKKKLYDGLGAFSLEYRYVMDRELLLKFYLNKACFGFSDSFFTTYSMGGVSDKGFLNGCVPESYSLSVKTGGRKSKALFKKYKSIMVFYLVKIRAKLYKKQGMYSFEEILTAIDKKLV